MKKILEYPPGAQNLFYTKHLIIINFGGNIFYVYLPIIPEKFEFTRFDCICPHKNKHIN